MVDITKANTEIIDNAINEDNFNEALSLLQDAIGGIGYTGDVAGVHFSGQEMDEDANLIEWRDKSKRLQIIQDYLKTEDSYSKLKNK